MMPSPGLIQVHQLVGLMFNGARFGGVDCMHIPVPIHHVPTVPRGLRGLADLSGGVGRESSTPI